MPAEFEEVDVENVPPHEMPEIMSLLLKELNLKLMVSQGFWGNDYRLEKRQ